MGFETNRRVVLSENERLLAELIPTDWDLAGDLLVQAESVFVVGGGRSGLAAQMAAMRLMHLGLTVHVAGEVTAPAIRGGDLLLAVSGSGTTQSVVDAARTATAVGASVIAVTTAPGSALGELAALVLAVPAADKQDHGSSVTEQYAGSLFEQGVLLAFDALFQSLWRTRNRSVEELWSRHANIG